jgi:hypothetical protein
MHPVILVMMHLPTFNMPTCTSVDLAITPTANNGQNDF